jgi:hypothetical protein
MPTALFVLVIYSDRASWFCLAPTWDCSPPNLLHSWAYRSTPPCPVYLLRFAGLGESGLAHFLPKLASNHGAPDLCLPHGWDYKCAPNACLHARLKMTKPNQGPFGTGLIGMHCIRPERSFGGIWICQSPLTCILKICEFYCTVNYTQKANYIEIINVKVESLMSHPHKMEAVGHDDGALIHISL